VSPTVTAPATGNYAVCGQYPGAVGSGATVTLTCTTDMPPYRYLIVQFLATNGGTFCELEVYVRRKFFSKLLLLQYDRTRDLITKSQSVVSMSTKIVGSSQQ